jgi:elongation factor P hydroxylase
MAVSATPRTASHLEDLFREAFFTDFNTLLVGGAAEPLYQPADEICSYHRLFFREDYFSSALHEIAHWCIAGDSRRQQLDFGYWYNPDGRTKAQQRAFEQVEIKPQALEWIFATAAGISFVVSADNLSADDMAAAEPSEQFLQALEAQVLNYCEQGLPVRPARFAAALSSFYGSGDPLDPTKYRGHVTGKR